MIINCPKCGFEQPKIEYCAKCGVSIDSYKKKAPALKDRITKNSLTYLIVILSIIFGTGLFIKNHWFSDSKKTNQFQPASINRIEQEKRKPANEENHAFQAAKESKKQEEKKEKEEAIQEESPHILIKIYEIPTSYLSFFEKRVLNVDDLSSPSLLYIDKADHSYLDRLIQTEPIYQTKYYVNAFQKPFLIQQSVYDDLSDDELGFYLSFSVDSYTQNQLLIRFDFSRNFYSSTDSNELQMEKLEETISFKEEDAYLMYGIMPQRQPHEVEKSLFSEGYLEIMNTPAFLATETSFAILFTYKY